MPQAVAEPALTPAASPAAAPAAGGHAREAAAAAGAGAERARGGREAGPALGPARRGAAGAAQSPAPLGGGGRKAGGRQRHARPGSAGGGGARPRPGGELRLPLQAGAHRGRQRGQDLPGAALQNRGLRRAPGQHHRRGLHHEEPGDPGQAGEGERSGGPGRRRRPDTPPLRFRGWRSGRGAAAHLPARPPPPGAAELRAGTAGPRPACRRRRQRWREGGWRRAVPPARGAPPRGVPLPTRPAPLPCSQDALPAAAFPSSPGGPGGTRPISERAWLRQGQLRSRKPGWFPVSTNHMNPGKSPVANPHFGTRCASLLLSLQHPSAVRRGFIYRPEGTSAGLSCCQKGRWNRQIERG